MLYCEFAQLQPSDVTGRRVGCLDLLFASIDPLATAGGNASLVPEHPYGPPTARDRELVSICCRRFLLWRLATDSGHSDLLKTLREGQMRRRNAYLRPRCRDAENYYVNRPMRWQDATEASPPRSMVSGNGERLQHALNLISPVSAVPPVQRVNDRFASPDCTVALVEGFLMQYKFSAVRMKNCPCETAIDAMHFSSMVFRAISSYFAPGRSTNISPSSERI